MIDNSVGTTTANSYVSLEEAAAYMLTRVGATKWEDLDEVEQEAYLLTSIRQLELSHWSGSKSTATQSLTWPRANVYDMEYRPIAGIPDKLKQAQLELAFWYLTEPDRFLSDTDLTQITSLNAGPLDIQVNGKPQVFPLYVEQLLNAIGPNVLVSSPNSSASKPTVFVI